MWMVWVFSLASVLVALGLAALFLAAFSRMKWRLLRDFLLFLILAVPGVLLPGWVAVLGDGNTEPPIMWFSVVSGSYLLGLVFLRVFAFRRSRLDPQTPKAAIWIEAGFGWVIAGTWAAWLLLLVSLYLLAGNKLQQAHEEAQQLFQAAPRQLDRGENAAAPYEQAYEQIERDETGHTATPEREGWEDEEEWAADAADFLARHREALRLLHEAVKYPGCQYEPPSIRTFQHPVGTLLDLRECTRLLELETHLALRSARPDMALDNVKALMSVARQKLETDAFCHLDFVFGLAFFGIGVGWLEETLSHPELAVDAAVRFEIPPIASGQTFRPLFLCTLDLVRAGGLETFREAEETYRLDSPFGALLYRFLLMPGDLAAFRDVMGRFRVTAELGYSRTVAEFGLHGADAPEWASTFTMVAASFFRDVLEANFLVAAADAQLRLAQTALAMHRFRARSGQFPRRLEELVPDDLEQIPLDPFNEKPLRLKVTDEGWKMYSVGQNQRDDGGDRGATLGGVPPDIVFEYPYRRRSSTEQR